MTKQDDIQERMISSETATLLVTVINTIKMKRTGEAGECSLRKYSLNTLYQVCFDTLVYHMAIMRESPRSNPDNHLT